MPARVAGRHEPFESDGLLAPSTPAAAVVARSSASSTATAAVIAPWATPAAAAPTRPFFPRPGQVHRQCRPAEVGPVHGLDGFLGFFLRGHRYEGKAARLASHTVRHEICLDHCPVRREGVLEVVFGDVEGNVSD